jgi:lipid-A-disaccharide synthase-like uncharacterized protein
MEKHCVNRSRRTIARLARERVLLRSTIGRALAPLAACLALALPALAQDRVDLDPTLIDDRAARAAPEFDRAPQAAPEVDLQQRLSKLEIVDDGGTLTVVAATDRGPLKISAEDYLAAVRRAQDEQRAHGWLYVVLNITSPVGLAWVALGFAGQALFTFRMVLQWLASEKQKRSVVPVAFWWGSLTGGAMLLVYFVWRKDVVGIVGQSTGVFVYARNLVLIHRAPAAGAEPSPGHARASP